jgi:hypothetical protein
VPTINKTFEELIRERQERLLWREIGMRLFLSLHQDDEPEYRRAGGGVICQLCQCEYRYHSYFDEQTMHGMPIDHRLCNGDVVHL